MRLFDYDSWLFVMFRKITDIVAVQILWILTSLPLVTLGATTTAMFCVFQQRNAGYEGSIVSAYFRACKAHAKRGTGLWFVIVAAAALLVVNLLFWNYVADGLFASAMAVLCLAFCVVLALLLMYGFAVQACFGESVRTTIRHALYLAYAHPLQSLSLGLLWGGVILLNCLVAYMNFVMISIGVSAVCCLCVRMMERMLPAAPANSSL